MTTTAAQFTGSIPEHYDAGLGPVLFQDFAVDMARRVAAPAVTDVLELAAGTGIVTRALRNALAPSARLVATDLNAPMLEVARRKFRASESVAFQPADAMALPFADASFDLIVCQFGVMFFPDKVAAFREARRVLRPNGRYLFSVWGPMSVNPYSVVAFDVGAEMFPDNPPGFYRVPFSYSDADAVRADVVAAGFSAPGSEAVKIDKVIDDWAPFARGLVMGNPFVAEIEARQDVSAGEVIDAMVAALEKKFGGAPTRMPLEAFVFTATRGGA